MGGVGVNPSAETRKLGTILQTERLRNRKGTPKSCPLPTTRPSTVNTPAAGRLALKAEPVSNTGISILGHAVRSIYQPASAR